MRTQREIIYGERMQVISEEKSLKPVLMPMIKRTIDHQVDMYTQGDKKDCLLYTSYFLAGIKVRELSLPLLGHLQLGWWSFPLTIFWILALTNAVNLIDGLDGLATGVTLISLVTVSYTHLILRSCVAELIFWNINYLPKRMVIYRSNLKQLVLLLMHLLRITKQCFMLVLLNIVGKCCH